MAILQRAAQTGSGPDGIQPTISAPVGIQPDIPAPISTALPSDTGRGGSIDAQTAPIIVSTTVIQPTTIIATPTPTATITPSATPAAAASHGLATGAIAGIVVAVVAVLMIPAVYLIWRSHQIKKEDERLRSQRSSQEAMITKETVEPKKDNGPAPPRPRRSPSDAPRERPANSLGLFNFDLGSAPATGPADPPKSPEGTKSAPRLSIARTLQMRRSEVSVVNQERRSQQQIDDLRNGLRNNPPTNRNSRENMRDAPPPYTGGATSPDSKFAPLNNIGTAVSAGRPKFSRNPSTSTLPRQPSPPPKPEMPRPRTATGPRKPPPGTQDMRLGPRPPLIAAVQEPPRTRTVNPPVSAYSMSDYHDSLRPEPRPEPRPDPSRPTLQPPEQVYGRAISPVHRSISPVNSYQLPTFGLGDDRFSWGVGGGGGSSSNNQQEADRTSDVSQLSYDPDGDNRKSNGRAISPVESDESLGMRTREYP